jgi:hypothetical protein
MGAIKQALTAGVAAFALVMASAGASAAHDDEHDEARVVVLQAIALIVNTPGDIHEIEERIEAVFEAADTEGVDLDLVEQAAAALEAADLQRTREQLQTSIGAGPFVGTGAPEPVREASGEPGRPAYAVGAEAGTTVVLDEYRADTELDKGDIALIVISAAVVIVGALLVWRYRPPNTVRQLRRADTPKGDRDGDQ